MLESEKLTGAKKRKTRGYKPPGSEWIPRTPRSRLLYDHVRRHFMETSNSASIPHQYIPVDPDIPPVIEEFEGDLALYGVDPEEIKKYEENFEAETKSSFDYSKEISSEHDSGGTEPVTPSDKQSITPEAVSPEDDDVFDSDKLDQGSFLRPRRLLPQRSFRAFSFEVDSSLYEDRRPSVMSEEPSTDYKAAYNQVTRGKKRLL